MAQQEAATSRPHGRGGNIALWILQGLLALMFVSAGFAKLSGVEESVQLFDDIGAGQWFRYFTGALDIAGAIGLLIPRLAGLAALGLGGLMVGAVVTHVFIAESSPILPLVLLVLTAVVAWGRRDRTAALLRRDPG